MRRRVVIYGLMILGVVSWACNYPGWSGAAPETPAALSVAELRQTLDAQSKLYVTPSALTPGVTSGAARSTPTMKTYPANPSPSVWPPDLSGYIPYTARSGDTLPALAGRFGVSPAAILAEQQLPAEGYLGIGQKLFIPNLLGELGFGTPLLPDGEIVNSPAAAGFDLRGFIEQAGGYLSTYQEKYADEWLSGYDIVWRVSSESSVNPRFLLGLIEFRSGWVFGQPLSQDARQYPIGFHASGQQGLYKELLLTATHLNTAYYGWRAGTMVEVKFADGSLLRLNPALNAGSVAVQSLFAKLEDQDGWLEALYGQENFLGHYQAMFGDPWEREARTGALIPDGLSQPRLELPFAPGEWWSLTGGPHASWKTGTPRGALDLAPVTGEADCAVSRAWVLASAPGLVVRSLRNVVALDLDGDGFEQTGWVIIYMHLADKERILVGSWVNTDDRLGHPSCEGGSATGTHVHIARKYNGEWLPADGPLPFVLSGWEAVAGEKEYQGELRRGDQVAIASPVGPRTSIVTR